MNDEIAGCRRPHRYTRRQVIAQWSAAMAVTSAAVAHASIAKGRHAKRVIVVGAGLLHLILKVIRGLAYPALALVVRALDTLRYALEAKNGRRGWPPEPAIASFDNCAGVKGVR